MVSKDRPSLYWPEAQMSLRVALSQKHPLKAVGGHAVLLLGLRVALRVGAAGRGALGGAQVVHQGQPVLPTEVNEFDVAHTRIKVHTWGAMTRAKSGPSGYATYMQ